MRHLTSSSALLLLLAACAACSEDRTSPEATVGAPAAATRSGAVVYGADDRVEWYQYPDAELRDRLRGAAVVQVDGSALTYEADGTVTLAPGPTLGRAADLCADQRFRDQPTSGGCSGVLIDRDLVLTAGHCVSGRDGCSDAAYVFDYLYEAPGSRPALSPDNVYRCAALVVDGPRHIPGRLDLAIVQLDRPVVGRTPLPVAFPVASPNRSATRGALNEGEPLLLAGFPNGIPLKLDAGGDVSNPRTAAGDYFVASVDAFHGNSGSPVLDQGEAVVGVLTSGADDFTSLGSCSVVAELPASPGQEGVHYAHHAVTTLCNRGFPSQALCPNAAPRCGDGFCTHDETFATCPSDCDGPFAVPDGWTCSPAWYGVRDDCDCDCGVRDPDCDIPNLRILNCARGSRCDAAGQCTVPLPDSWVCNPNFYNAGDDCDCSCGAWDPDCARPELRTVGCRSGGACLADGTCSNPAPDAWTCVDAAWNNGNACHCGCGAPDPDCALPGRTVIGCALGSACLPDGSCEVPFPETWVCAPGDFGNGGRCDCNCGAWDPDCGTSTLAPLNCAAGLVCDPSGSCVDPSVTPPEPGPEPVPEVAPEEAEADASPEAVADAPPAAEPAEDAGAGDDAGAGEDATGGEDTAASGDGGADDAATGAPSDATPDAATSADVRTAVIPGRRVVPEMGCAASAPGARPSAETALLLLLGGLFVVVRARRRARGA